ANADDPIHAFEIINGELTAFNQTLGEKPMIVVATKLDATTDRTRLNALLDFCAKRKLEFHSISAASGEGIRDLVRGIADALDKIPRNIPEPTLDSNSEQSQNANSASIDQRA